MIKEVISYIKKNELVSLSDIAIHFEMDKSAMEGLLGNLIKKNYIEKYSYECNGCSSNCSDCSSIIDSIYYRMKRLRR